MQEQQQPLITVTFERGQRGDVIGHTDHANKICFAHRNGLQPKPGGVWSCRVLRDTDPSSRRKGALIVELVTQHVVSYDITWTDVESVGGNKRPCGITATARGISTYIQAKDAPVEIAAKYEAALVVYQGQVAQRKAELAAEIDRLIAAGTIPQFRVLDAHAANSGTNEITVQAGWGLPYVYAPPALEPLTTLMGIDRARFLLRTFGLPSNCWREWDGTVVLSWSPYRASVPTNELFRKFETLGDRISCVLHLDGVVLGSFQVGTGPYAGRWGRHQVWFSSAEQAHVRSLIEAMPLPANWYEPASKAAEQALRLATEYVEQATATQWELTWVDTEYETGDYLSPDERSMRSDIIRSRQITAASENGTWTFGIDKPTCQPYEGNWTKLVRELRTRTKKKSRAAIEEARKNLGGPSDNGYASVVVEHTAEYEAVVLSLAHAEELLARTEHAQEVDPATVKDVLDKAQRKDLRDLLGASGDDEVRIAWATRTTQQSLEQANQYFESGVLPEGATVEVLDLVARYTGKLLQTQTSYWNRKGFRDVGYARFPRFINGSNNRPSRKECLEIIAHNNEAAREGEAAYNKWLGKSG